MKSLEKVRLLIFSHNQRWFALWLPQSTLACGHSSSTFAAHRALWCSLVILCYNRVVNRNPCKCMRKKTEWKCTRNPCKCERERKCTRKPCKCTRRINEIVQETGSQSWLHWGSLRQPGYLWPHYYSQQKSDENASFNNILKPVDLWCHYCTKYEAQPIDEKHCLGFGLPVSNLGSFFLTQMKLEWEFKQMFKPGDLCNICTKR